MCNQPENCQLNLLSYAENPVNKSIIKDLISFVIVRYQAYTDIRMYIFYVCYWCLLIFRTKSNICRIIPVELWYMLCLCMI